MKNRKKSPAPTKLKTLIKNLKKWPIWKKTIALICLSAILIFGLANFYEFGRQKAWWGYSDEAIFLRHHEIFRWRNENLSKSTVEHPPVQGFFGVLSVISQKTGIHSTLTLYAKKGKIDSLHKDLLNYLNKTGWRVNKSEMVDEITAFKKGNPFMQRLEINTYIYDEYEYINCEIFIGKILQESNS